MSIAFNQKFSDMREESTSSKSVSQKKGLSRFIPSARVALCLVIILQLLILYVVLNPLNLLQQLSIVQVINEVSKLTPVPPAEIPSVVAVIGDGTNLPDISVIKNQNSFNATVYKDAQDGDYVLAYTNKMIIFRKSEDKIIYNGDSPVALQSGQQSDLATSVIKAAKTANIIPSDNSETPQLSVISDVSKLSGTNADFYKDALQDDIVVIFAQAGKILIYRSSSDSIVNSGDYKFVINQ